MKRWFSRRRESKVLDLAHRQMTRAIDTVTELQNSFNAISKGDKKEAKKCIERLFIIEAEIDDLRRSVFEELTKGSMPSKDREDIMHLVKRLDVMADHVKDSARSVMILIETELPEGLLCRIHDIGKNLLDCAITIRDAIEKLGSDRPKARALSRKIDRIEKEVDEKYLKIKEELLSYGRELNPVMLMVLDDLLESMERATDVCEDTADYLRILTITREVA